MAAPAPAVVTAFSEEVKPYKIHVSRKYLDLTRQKLELTRLPHETSEPKSKDWWEPKDIVEPLIDFWVEQYSWYDEETRLNATVPQFRTSFLVPGSQSAVRIHFIYARSTQVNALPLLLIPPFPFTNLSLIHVIPLLTAPEDAGPNQAFHLIIPSLPGLGFSDALPNNTPMIEATGEMLNTLMKRLDCKHYMATNSGPAASAPSQIDWKIASYLAVNYQDSCLGVHFISPPLRSPKAKESPLEWAKWKVASLTKLPGLGYSREDLASLRRTKKPSDQMRNGLLPGPFGFGGDGLCEPSTLSYALCDSPTGLLLFILMILRVFGPEKEFSPREIITLTQMTWLPGPEATIRFWAYCASTSTETPTSTTRKPRAGITVFVGDGEVANGEQPATPAVLPRPATLQYACPSWGNVRYSVISTKRVAGKPGLLVWERPEVIVDGVQSMAKAILEMDKRTQTSEQQGAVLLEQVVVDNEGQEPPNTPGTTVREAVESPSSDPSLPRRDSSPIEHPQISQHKPERQSASQQALLEVEGPTGQSRDDGDDDDDEDDDDSSPDTVVLTGNKDSSSPSS